MAFNGSGVFQRLYNWVQDRNNGIKINATRMDAEFDGIATALSTCVTKDGQTAITADLPMSGFKHTAVANGSARNHYAAIGQLQDGAFVWAGTAGGAANAQTLTPSPVITAYAAGQAFEFLPFATNTSGTVTIANSALAARAVKKSIGGALVALAVGDMQLNVPARILDDGTQYVLQNPRTYSHGADIASAGTINLDTATGDLVDITGTTGITAITLAEGREITCRFTGILTITNGASLVLPGASDIKTEAGAFITFRGYASGVVRAVNYQSAATNETKSSAVATAGTIDLDAMTGNFGHLTGTTNVTAVTLAAGRRRTLVADAAFLLTDNASINVQGNASYTTAAGDILTFYGEGGGVVYVAIQAANAIIGPTTAYTPTWVGFGTVSNSDVTYRRIGDKLRGDFKVTSGTSTGVEARLPLPSGLTIDATKNAVIKNVGTWCYAANSAVMGTVLAEAGSVGYVTFGTQSAGAAGLTKQLGNGMVSNGSVISGFFEVPITQWA